MPSRPSPWRLLHPKWLLLHLAVVAACGAMIWLGRWQWGAAHRHHGELRNYAYALQWWAFTVFTLVMWWRVVRDYLHPAAPGEADAAGEPERGAGKAEPSEAVGTGGYVGYTPPPLPADDDPERARFNAYLARLHASDSDAATEAPRPAGQRAADREESR